MLVIVSGMQTINVNEIAKDVSNALNTYTVDGFKVNFYATTFKVTDSIGKVIYSSNYPGQENVNELLINVHHNGSPNPQGIETFNKIEDLRKQLIDYRTSNHYSISFAEDTPYDNGFKDWSEVELNYPTLYSEMLAKYNSKTEQVQVISGTFSKRIIDKLKADLGDANVVALNVVRNPSSAYICQQRPEEFYADPVQEKISHMKRLRLSIWCAVTLAKKGVTTLKFEDLIRNQSFELNGNTVRLSTIFNPFNNWITRFESTYLVSAPAELAEFNTWGENFNTKYVEISDEADQQLLANALNALPNNVFVELGYPSLTYEQVTAP